MLGPSTSGARDRAGEIAALVALLVGAALRFYPVLAPYPGCELQDGYPRSVVVAFANGEWESPFKSHGTALFVLLRVLLTLWYGLGRAVGFYEQRADLVASFVGDQAPFIIAGRLVVVGAALWTIVLVGRLGRELFGTSAAVAGMLFLAVAFAHVRESHNVWPDVPSALVALLGVVAALRAWQRPGVRPAMLAGLTGGLALAFKPSVLPIALPVAIGAWGPSGMRWSMRVMRLLAAAATALAINAFLAPDRLWTLLASVRWMRNQAFVTFASDVPVIPIPTYLQIGLGWPIVVLAMIGVVGAATRRPRMEHMLAATFGIAYAAVLLAAGYRFMRYLAILAPFMALYAGYGASVVVSWARNRRGWATAALAVAVSCGPALACMSFIAALARPDTRVLAGAWLAAHAAPGTRITVPDVLACPSPILPPDNTLLLSHFRAAKRSLAPYGFGVPGRTHPVQRIAFLGRIRRGWKPEPGFVVTVSHPIVFPELDTSPEALAMLEEAGARRVAQFAGLEEPVPHDVVFDRIDADYVPVRGAQHVARPGPTLTIWEVPRVAVRARPPAGGRRRDRRPRSASETF